MKQKMALGFVMLSVFLLSCSDSGVASDTGTKEKRITIPSSTRDNCPEDTALENQDLFKLQKMVAYTAKMRLETDMYNNEGYLLNSQVQECILDDSDPFSGCYAETPDRTNWKTGYVFTHQVIYMDGEKYQDIWQCFYYRKMSTSQC